MARTARGLLAHGELDAFGGLLDEGWRVKQQLASKVGNDAISAIYACLLYTSDAADERSSVDLGGRRIIKKKKNQQTRYRAIREK